MKVKPTFAAYLVLIPVSVAFGGTPAEAPINPTPSSEFFNWAKVVGPFVVAFVSLAYSHHTNNKVRLLQKRDHDKDYALKAFERDVVAPVTTALGILTDMTTGIVDACHQKDGKKRGKAFLKLEDKLLPKILDARRHCREADLYLIKRGIQGILEDEFNGYETDACIDDFFFGKLGDAISSPKGDCIRISNEISEAIAERKAHIRSILTDMGERVAIEAYRRNKCPNRFIQLTTWFLSTGQKT